MDVVQLPATRSSALERSSHRRCGSGEQPHRRFHLWRIGAPTGPIHANSTDKVVDKLTLGRFGDYEYQGGTGTARDHTNTENTHTETLTVALNLNEGHPLGRMDWDVIDDHKYNYHIDRTFEREAAEEPNQRLQGESFLVRDASGRPAIHSRTKADGEGHVVTHDHYNVLYEGSETPDVSRHVVITQTGEGHTDQTTTGELSDSQHHWGWWKETFTNDHKINDKVTLDFVAGEYGWQETDRTFSLDRDTKTESTYLQWDNGLGIESSPWDPQDQTGHQLFRKVTFNRRAILDGNPEEYDYTFNEGGSKREVETLNREWSRTDPNEGGNSQSRVVKMRTGHDHRTGGFRDGEFHDDTIDHSLRIDNSSTLDSHSSSPNLIRDTHRREHYVSTEGWNRSAEGQTGRRAVYTRTALWGTTYHPEYQEWGDEHAPGYWPVDMDLSTTGSPPEQHFSLADWVAAGIGDVTVMAADIGHDVIGGVAGSLHLWDGDEVFNAGAAEVWDEWFGGTWLHEYGFEGLRILGGLIDVGVGGASFAGGPAGVVVGVGLMSVGIDQIITGVWNIATDTHTMSALEGGVYEVTGSETAAFLSPVLVSGGIMFGVWWYTWPRIGSPTSVLRGGSAADDLPPLLPRPQHPHGHGFTLRDINPSGNRLNCAECAVIVDDLLGGLPRRGLSALEPGVWPRTARAAPDTLHLNALERIYGREFSVWIEDLAALRAEIEAAGSGARGIVFGVREGAKEGHFFNVVNQGGHVRFLCGQLGGQIDPTQFLAFRLLRLE